MPTAPFSMIHMASSGILADDEDDEAGDQQRHDEVEQRDQPHIDPGRKFAPRAGHQAASFDDAGHEQAELALVGARGRARP